MLELTLAAQVAGWVTEHLGTNPQLPFSRAAIEIQVPGSNRRHDFCLYGRSNDLPVLTGEIKMPDTPMGRHPLNPELVEDALSKAFHTGVKYCFTWNVRQFVLFDSQRQNLPIAERNIEGPTQVIQTSERADLANQASFRRICDFWKHFLQDFADLLADRRPLNPPPH